MKCNKCQTEVSKGDKFCPDCGTKIIIQKEKKAEFNHCSKCGAKLGKDDAFCPDCGEKKKSNNRLIIILSIVGISILILLLLFFIFKNDSKSIQNVVNNSNKNIVVTQPTNNNQQNVNKNADNIMESTSNLAAIVNGEKILLTELDTIYNRLPDQTKSQVTKKELLNQTINEKLLVQEAKKIGIIVNQTEINDFLNKLLIESAISKEEFLKRLELQNITEKMVQDEIYKQLIIKKIYQKEIIDKTTISDNEQQNYYNINKVNFTQNEQVRVSHILICSKESISCTSTLTKDEALVKIKDIKTKVTTVNFASLAKQYSQDGSSSQGGDLGFFSKGTMVQSFEDASFSTPVGSISDIVETQYGYHLILVTDKKAGQILPFIDVSSEIKQILLAQKQQDNFKIYIDNLKQKSDIKIYLK